MRTTTNSSTESAGPGPAAPKDPKTNSEGKSSQKQRRIAFQSVLTKPFSLWNEIEDLVAEFLPEWSPSQRSCLIKNLLRFLELKVVLEEYRTNKLLAPTQLVACAWNVLVLETELYRDVTFAIQDYHGRPHRMIHHSLSKKSQKNKVEEQLCRTQRLFESYYRGHMPSDLKEIDAAALRNTSFIGRRSTSSGKIPPIESSIVSTSWENDEREEDDLEEEEKNEGMVEEGDHRWYTTWLPSCHCFPVPLSEAFCSKEDILADDIYAVKEDVSLLTPIDSLPDE